MRRLHRLIQLFGVAALAASLVLNYLLYKEARKWYRSFNIARREPLNLDQFDEEAPPVGRPLILFYGDSRASAWPAPAFTGATFANRAIAGHTTQQCLIRFPDHAAPLEADVLVLQVGINDLLSIGTQSHLAAEITQETGDRIVALVEEARAQGAIVILTTIFPPARVPLARRPVWSPEIYAAVDTINERLRAVEKEGVIVMDTVPILTDGEALTQDRYAYDELHLNEAGYEALNEALLPVLEEALSRLP